MKHYLTKKQYMEKAKVSRQSIWNRANRGTLKIIKRTEPVDHEVIVLTQKEFDDLSRITICKECGHRSISVDSATVDGK